MTGFRPKLSLRGAKRRDNPHPKHCKSLSASVKSIYTRGRIATPVCGLARNDSVVLKDFYKFLSLIGTDNLNSDLRAADSSAAVRRVRINMYVCFRTQ